MEKEKEDENRKPGQPKKADIIDTHPLRFRKNYPNLKKGLKSLMKSSKYNSLNDFIIEILNNYLITHMTNKNVEEIEKNFGIILSNINSKINELETQKKIKWPHPLEIIGFKELIFNFYPNPIERQIFYLKFFESSLFTEFSLLYMLLESPSFDFEITSKNYIDYVIERDKIKKEKRKTILNEVVGDFLERWFFELELYEIIKDRQSFEICPDKLETFLFTIMYPDLKTVSPFDEKEYKIIQREWDQILKTLDSELKDLPLRITLPEIKEYTQFTFESTKKIFHFLVTLLDELRQDSALGLRKGELRKIIKQFFNKQFKEIQLVNEYMKNIIPIIDDSSDHDGWIKLIKSLDIPKDINLLKKYENIYSLFKKVNLIRQNLDKMIPKYYIIPQITDSSFTKEAFLNNLCRYYDFLLKNRHIEYNINSFLYPNIFFSPFILINFLDLEGYYDYLKKKELLIDFYPNEEELKKKL